MIKIPTRCPKCATNIVKMSDEDLSCENNSNDGENPPFCFQILFDDLGKTIWAVHSTLDFQIKIKENNNEIEEIEISSFDGETIFNVNCDYNIDLTDQQSIDKCINLHLTFL